MNLNPIVFALRHPYTVMVGVAVVIVLPSGGLVITGAAIAVSSVKASAPLAEMLPATSVCRASTLFAPSPVSVRLVPVPGV